MPGRAMRSTPKSLPRMASTSAVGTRCSRPDSSKPSSRISTSTGRRGSGKASPPGRSSRTPFLRAGSGPAELGSIRAVRSPQPAPGNAPSSRHRTWAPWLQSSRSRPGTKASARTSPRSRVTDASNSPVPRCLTSRPPFSRQRAARGWSGSSATRVTAAWSGNRAVAHSGAVAVAGDSPRYVEQRARDLHPRPGAECAAQRARRPFTRS